MGVSIYALVTFAVEVFRVNGPARLVRQLTQINEDAGTGSYEARNFRPEIELRGTLVPCTFKAVQKGNKVASYKGHLGDPPPVNSRMV